MQYASQDLAEWCTFKELAKRYCANGAVRYTTKGGLKGGEEAAAYIADIEAQRGYGPEVLLSVDTMALLPGALLDKYQCFSAHPGPLDTVKIEGMQATLRSLVNQVFYDWDGKPLPDNHVYGMGLAHIKGTLFMQHPELDKGPAIKVAYTPVMPGICAYQTREDLYHALITQMLKLLPTLVDRDARHQLVEQATRNKATLETLPHTRIGELEAHQFAKWQSKAVGVANGAGPWGIEVFQNKIIDPRYFESQMFRFFPGAEVEFATHFNPIFGSALDRLDAQRRAYLAEDHWALFYSGEQHVIIERRDPKTWTVIEAFDNRGPSG